MCRDKILGDDDFVVDMKGKQVSIHKVDLRVVRLDPIPEHNSAIVLELLRDECSAVGTS